MKTEADFQLDFVLDQKAAVTEQGDGSLLIEGYASDFGYDRQDEAFEPGAFDQGMKAFMDSNPIVVYHHKYDKAMGRVLDWEKKAQGIWVKAQVDKAEPGTELADVFHKVENGTIRGFSIGGKFHRRPGADGRARIYKADVAELSITPLPINPRTLFAVAGKAFGEDEPEFDIKAATERLTTVRELLDDLEGKAVSAAKRKEAKYHYAGTDKFPIDNCADVKKAVGLAGNSSEDKAKVQAYIKRTASALGCSNLIPEDWS